MLLAEILEAREELEMATSVEEVDTIRQTNQGMSTPFLACVPKLSKQAKSKRR